MENRADRRVVPLLPPEAPLWFPPLEEGRDSGLLAAGGDLTAERLLYAYSRGIFPWYDEGTPILWWSPDPRCVLIPSEFVVSRSLMRTLRKQKYSVSINQAFSQVIRHCASQPRPGQSGTWLVPEMIEAYENMHALGHAWSVESWENDELVGGLYGILLGRVFFGESMFHLRPDASKVALASLIQLFRQMGVELVDCQQTTPHMLSLGAREISRARFSELLEQLIG